MQQEIAIETLVYLNKFFKEVGIEEKFFMNFHFTYEDTYFNGKTEKTNRLYIRLYTIQHSNIAGHGSDENVTVYQRLFTEEFNMPTDKFLTEVKADILPLLL